MLVPGHAHCTSAVKSLELLSEYVPLAVKAWVVPGAMAAVAGLIVIDCRTTCPLLVGGGVTADVRPSPQLTISVEFASTRNKRNFCIGRMLSTHSNGNMLLFGKRKKEEAR
jgi:hypothetical protein